MSRGLTQSQTGNPAQVGFTLVELLVALAILGIALSVATLRLWDTRPDAIARAAAFSLATDLRAARGQAIETDRETSVTLNVMANKIGRTHGSRIFPRQLKMEFRQERRDQTQSATKTIRFFPDGSSSGGVVRFEDQGRFHTVSTDWLTGSVAVDE